MRQITIAGQTISDDTDAWIIAELGHNHGGSMDTAHRMIEAAADAGANAVKLQKRANLSLYTTEAYNRPYTSENAYGATYGKHREALEFSANQHYDLAVEAQQHGLVYFATPFDAQSAEELATLVSVPVFKIASSDIVNLPLLREVAQYRRPMILSTGAATELDVERAINTVWPINTQLALLQCTAEYPCAPERLNLNVISTYREHYPDIVVGLSSHYSGISDVIAAYVLGARIFEKHFTLSRASKGTDHPFSLEPAGFAKMVSYARKTRLMLGSGQKNLLPEEAGAIDKMRKATRWWQEQYGEVA